MRWDGLGRRRANESARRAEAAYAQLSHDVSAGTRRDIVEVSGGGIVDIVLRSEPLEVVEAAVEAE